MSSNLSAEGYRPSIDGDGDVKFKREGRTYFIIVSEKDPEFFRLVLANIWEIENDVERSRVLQAADHSNAASKVSKVYIVKDNVWVCVELFVAAPEDFRGRLSAFHVCDGNRSLELCGEDARIPGCPSNSSSDQLPRRVASSREKRPLGHSTLSFDQANK